MPKKPTDKPRKPPGFPPQRLKLEGDWQQNVAKALQVKKPEGGWPKPGKAKGGSGEASPSAR